MNVNNNNNFYSFCGEITNTATTWWNISAGYGVLVQWVIPEKVQTPCTEKVEVIYHKNIYIFLVGDVTLTVYKVMIFNIKSPLMKTLDQSVDQNVGS